MRLTLKLTLALTIILILQFSLYGYLVAQRLSKFLERDIQGDALQIGQALSTAVARTWKKQGSNEAIALVSETNDSYAEIQIRFVWLSAHSDQHLRPAIPLEELKGLENERFVVKHVYPDPDSDYIYTYVRVPVEGSEHAAIELRQSFAPENRFTTISILRVAAFLFVVVLTTAFVMWFLGWFLIARPIQRLSDKARRIGRGDFSDHIEITGRDEIALLAREVNQMNDALSDSRRRIEEETSARIDAVEQLRHADRLTTIGTLASGVAHELGTPLTVASGHVTTLGPETPSAQIAKVKSALTDQLDKMAGIVSQLLSFSRRKTPEKKLIALQDIVERVVQMLTPFGEKRRILMKYIPGDAPAMAEVDSTQMEQVLTNLIVNAMQAMESGEIEVGITSENVVHPEHPLEKSLPHHRIYVKDFGSGMSEEQVKQVFDPFFTTKAPGKGTGMGLSIAHGIVREHGGWIKVKTELGKGSCFSVYIPTEGVVE